MCAAKPLPVDKPVSVILFHFSRNVTAASAFPEENKRKISFFIAERTQQGRTGRHTCVGVRSGDRAFLFTSSLFSIVAKTINKRMLKLLLALRRTPNVRGRKVW